MYVVGTLRESCERERGHLNTKLPSILLITKVIAPFDLEDLIDESSIEYASS